MAIVCSRYKNGVIRVKLSGLILGLMVFFTSCSRKDNDLTVEIQSKQLLQQLVDKGSLLNAVTMQGEDYQFEFETATLVVAAKEIERLVPEPEQWKTLLTFADGTRLTVPSKGTKLDFIVESIQLNPSGYNPLAAIVNVHLPTYGRVKVSVRGKAGDEGTITHLCQSQIIRQAVPIFGLYAEYDNRVDLTFTDKDGNERGSTQIVIRTEALPVQDFPQIEIIKSQPENMEPGVNLVSYPGESELDVSVPYMVDHTGEVRWVLLLKTSPGLQQLSASIGLKRTRKGTFIAGDQMQPRVVELDMFGNLLREWDLKKPGYTFHHEITESKSGSFLVNVSKSSARLVNGQPRVNDHIIELDPVSGSVVKEWDLAAMLDTSRYVKPDGITPPQFSQSPNNWAHNNSIQEMGSDLLATMRYQGIMSFTPAGKLKWIISPHQYWNEACKPYLLHPVDEQGQPVTDNAVINGNASAEGFDWSWGPHTPVALSDNRILVFDNGYNRNWVSNALTPANNYSRVVEYKIDETQRTVQQVWSYGKERGAQCFSQAISGVQYLPQTKHVLFCPGMGVPTGNGFGGRVVELDPLTRQVVFEMAITVPGNSAFHRVTRMPLYDESF